MDPHVRQLLHDLETGSPRARYVARENLVALGAPGVDAFAYLLASPDAELRTQACTGLAALGPLARRAARPLLAQLSHADRGVRADALHALAAIGARLGGATRLIAARLDDEHLMVRTAAARLLTRMGRTAADAIPDLEHILAHGDPDDGKLQWLRFEVARALWQVAGPNPRSVAALAAHARTTCAAAAHRVARALSRLRPADESVERALTALLSSSDRAARHHARVGLERAARARARRRMTPDPGT